MENGLTSAQAAERLAKHGPNELIGKEPPKLWMMLLGQFKDFLVLHWRKYITGIGFSNCGCSTTTPRV